MVAKYWALYTDEIDGFATGSMVAGTAWPVNLSTSKADARSSAVDPEPRASRAGRDTWMISTNAPHPNCMLSG